MENFFQKIFVTDGYFSSANILRAPYGFHSPMERREAEPPPDPCVPELIPLLLRSRVFCPDVFREQLQYTSLREGDLYGLKKF